jgi:hypothetical protein
MKMKKHSLIVLLFCLSLMAELWAQTPTQNYQNQSVQQGKLSAEKWKSSVQAIDYTPRPRRPPSQRNFNPPPRWTPRSTPNLPSGSFDFSGNFLQIIAIGGVILVVLIILFRFLMNQKGNATVRRPEDITIEEVEQNLHEAEIDRFLREALGSQNYRLAVRLYFLNVMKELSLKRIIEWQKDKTNGVYLREVRANSRDWYDDFARITLIFEYVWYSETPLTAASYAEIEPFYKNLLKKVS